MLHGFRIWSWRTIGIGLMVCSGGLGLLSLPVNAVGDWPEFRGPTRQGIVSADQKLPTRWSRTEGIAWRTELPGQGWSSPVVVGDRIYLTAAVPVAPPAEVTAIDSSNKSVAKTAANSAGAISVRAVSDSSESPSSSSDSKPQASQAAAEEKPAPKKPPERPAPVDYHLTLFILQADSGDVLRRVDLFRQVATEAPKIHQKNSHASPTPVYDGERLYLHFGHQGIACVTLTGEIVWKNAELSYPPVHGNGGSPVVVGDLLIFSRDGADISEVNALDKRTGQLQWTTQRDVEVEKRFSFCTPLLIEVQGQPQLIFPGSNVVQSLNPADGQEIWRVEYDGYSVVPRPILAGNKVLICTGYNRPSLLAIDPTGQGNVTETHVRWQTDSNVPNTPSLVAWENRVAMVSDRGIATCLDLETGEEVWRKRIGGNFSASPLLHGSTLYLLSEEGDCTLLDVSQDEPQEIVRNSIQERTLASLVVIGEDLLLRSAEGVYRISR